jgi:hypothetical protein
MDLGKGLIDRLFPDKIAQAQERARAELELQQVLLTGDLEKTRVQLSAIIAEAQSQDPWTSRARPTFLYVIYIMILASIPMGFVSAFRPDIALAVAAGMKAWLGAIPGELYALFGAGYLGYAHFRSQEKKGK